MKYNIGDVVSCNYGKSLIVGKDTVKYIVLFHNNSWTINLKDCSEFDIDKKYIGERGLFIRDNQIDSKILVLDCVGCRQKYINLDIKYSYQFICWSCKIEFL